MLLWSFRSLDSPAAVLKQLLDLQLTQLRTSRTRAASSCRYRISRYQIKKPKTANFIGIKYNSQSIFASLSHSNWDNTTCISRRQQVFQGEGEKNFGGKQPFCLMMRHGSCRDRPVPKLDISNPQKTWGFYYWSLGVCPSPGCTGPVPNLSSVIYPQAVGNYGSLGVCELRTTAVTQRAPGRLNHAIGHLPWSTLFVGVWEFQHRQKRL